ncbi:MAG TPA: hypothetical protein VFB69_08030 [Candidatus Dormibacteraeota bacterium]|nr:hypothetical protein [Candidatus Dormibacteraeota bacterium]
MLNAISPFKVRWVMPAVGLAAGVALLGAGAVSASGGSLPSSINSAISAATCGYKLHTVCKPNLGVKKMTLAPIARKDARFPKLRPLAVSPVNPETQARIKAMKAALATKASSSK